MIANNYRYANVGLESKNLVATSTSSASSSATTTASTSATTREARERLQLRRDFLSSTVENIDEFPGKTCILFSDKEGYGVSLLSSTASSANPVDVTVHLFGKVKVDDNLNVVNV
jgi:hypothetical protein